MQKKIKIERQELNNVIDSLEDSLNELNQKHELIYMVLEKSIDLIIEQVNESLKKLTSETQETLKVILLLAEQNKNIAAFSVKDIIL